MPHFPKASRHASLNRMGEALFPTFTVFAHRGASGHEPENTLRSFRRALELGAKWIELDVRVVEGVPLVFHDRTLNRCAGKSGVFERQRLDFLRSLDVGQGEKIPTLAEVVELARDRARLQVELKGPNCAPAAAQLLGRAISAGASPDSFLVSSFDSEQTALFRRLLPQVPVGCLAYGYPRRPVELASSLGAVSFHLNLDAVTPARVAELQSVGLKVFSYTVNTESDLKFATEAGVDGVFTDFLDRMAPFQGRSTRPAPTLSATGSRRQ